MTQSDHKFTTETKGMEKPQRVGVPLFYPTAEQELAT